MQPGALVSNAVQLPGKCLTARVGDQAGDHIGVHVGVGPAVLDVALLVDGHLPRDSDGGTTVGHAVVVLVEALGLVLAGEALLGTVAVPRHVFGNLAVGTEGLACRDDRVIALSHCPRGKVGVCSGTIPVALDGLGIDRGVHAELLGDAVQQVTGHPDLVADTHGVAGSDLELPLAEHHLGVGAGDLEAGIDTGLGVGLDDLAAGYLNGTHTAVVGALRGRVALDRPSQRAPLLEEGVLLFDAEDRLLVAVPVERLDAGCACVGGMGCHLTVGQADVAQHQHVVAAADGVGAREHRPEDTVGVVTWSLVCA